MRKFKEDLLSNLRLEQLIEEAKIELRNAKKHGAVISSSGGIDSEVIYHIAKTNNFWFLSWLVVEEYESYCLNGKNTCNKNTKVKERW